MKHMDRNTFGQTKQPRTGSFIPGKVGFLSLFVGAHPAEVVLNVNTARSPYPAVLALQTHAIGGPQQHRTMVAERPVLRPLLHEFPSHPSISCVVQSIACIFSCRHENLKRSNARTRRLALPFLGLIRCFPNASTIPGADVIDVAPFLPRGTTRSSWSVQS